MTTKKPKPPISAQEADWHAHKAGTKASAEAAKSDSEIALETLDKSTPDQIDAACGWDMRPVTIGTSIEVAKIVAYFQSLPTTDDTGELTERDMRELAIVQMAYADTLRFRLLRKDGWDPVIEEADRINYTCAYEDRIRLVNHMGDCISLIGKLSGNTLPEPDAVPGKE